MYSTYRGALAGTIEISYSTSKREQMAKRKEISDAQVAAAELQIEERAKKIDYYINEYTVEFLAQKTKNGDYVVPSYQREFTWEESRKWRFIESLLMGLPIPFIFFWEDPSTGKLEIVDGSQRLRTMAEFISDDLVMGPLDKLPELEGFRFSDLLESRQRKILNRSIRGIVLSNRTDAEARFDLFDRINTGSKVANKAEIRRGALTGPFMDLVIELAQTEPFVDLAPVSEKQLKEREREELVVRFFAYGAGLEEYADEVSPFLFAYSQRMNKQLAEHPESADEMRKLFSEVMVFVKDTFPNGFRRTPTGKATPRARFESIAIGSQLALRQKPDLRVGPDVGIAITNDPTFRERVRSDAANVTSKLEGRLNFVRDRLLEMAPSEVTE